MVRFRAVFDDLTVLDLEAPHILAAICVAEQIGGKPVRAVCFIGEGEPPPLPALYTHPAGPL